MIKDNSLQAPAVMIIACRLKLFNRVVKRAPSNLFAQVAAARAGKRSWARAVIADFHKIAPSSQCDHARAVLAGSQACEQPLDTPLAAVYALCRDHSQEIQRSIRKFALDPVSSETRSWAAPKVAKLFEHHACEFCGKSFSSRAAAAVH